MEFDGSAFEVEFSQQDGTTYAMETIPATKLMLLHYEQTSCKNLFHQFMGWAGEPVTDNAPQKTDNQSLGSCKNTRIGRILKAVVQVFLTS